jgi:holin-like protein
MPLLTGLAWLLLCQSAGEVLVRLLALPLPGPVVGMLILLLALRLEFVRAPVGAVADALLAHLSLLFVPVGVGVMTHMGLLSTYGLRMLVAIVLSTWIGLVVTALVLRWLLRRECTPDPLR